MSEFLILIRIFFIQFKRFFSSPKDEKVHDEKIHLADWCYVILIYWFITVITDGIDICYDPISIYNGW